MNLWNNTRWFLGIPSWLYAARTRWPIGGGSLSGSLPWQPYQAGETKTWEPLFLGPWLWRPKRSWFLRPRFWIARPNAPSERVNGFPSAKAKRMERLMWSFSEHFWQFSPCRILLFSFCLYPTHLSPSDGCDRCLAGSVSCFLLATQQ